VGILACWGVFVSLKRFVVEQSLYDDRDSNEKGEGTGIDFTTMSDLSGRSRNKVSLEKWLGTIIYAA
jgi:hypothetical protein